MSDKTTCKVCKQPLAVHHLVLIWGVAHAAVYDGSGHSRPCSEIASDWSHIQGRIQALESVIRSLRWHAGRLRTNNRQWDTGDLADYSDRWAKQIEQLIGNTQEYYAWAKDT